MEYVEHGGPRSVVRLEFNQVSLILTPSWSQLELKTERFQERVLWA